MRVIADRLHGSRLAGVLSEQTTLELTAKIQSCAQQRANMVRQAGSACMRRQEGSSHRAVMRLALSSVALPNWFWQRGYGQRGYGGGAA